MKGERLRALGAFVLALTCVSMGTNISAAQARTPFGKLAGVVNDSGGTPQMGASVELVPEAAGGTAPLGFLTNTQGIFRGERLAPGLYTLRVTLAGFLPTLQQHVRISAHVTTVVRVQLESMFASLDQLRRRPATVAVESDDWKWVLRSASVTRPVLQWTDDASAANTETRNLHPHARLDFTDGARRPGSASNIPSAPATDFAYDQSLGGTARLLLAGEMSYEGTAPGGGFATVWLPAGSLSNGPHSTLVVRESKLGPGGPTFRGVRMEQAGAIELHRAALLRYGAEYVMVGVAESASALRPHLELNLRPSDTWQAALIFAGESGASTPLDSDERQIGGDLAGVLDELDAFPTMLWRAGRPVVEGGWHEELAVERKVGPHTTLQVAGFHDDDRHVALFGRGSDLPAADYFQDYFSNGFAYDGGASSSWGTRIAVRDRLSDSLELAAVYAYAGALNPAVFAEGGGPLRDFLRTAMHNSLGMNVAARLPYFGTKLDGGYKWVSGTAVSRVDAYGESLYQMEPFVHVGVRQALPKFGPGRWEANARCDNLFSQGYASISTQDGRAVLVPAFRSFRGGLSVQF